MGNVAGSKPSQTMSLEEFFQTLGYNRTSGYKLAREDRLPVPVIRVGRRLLVSRRAVEALLDRTQDGRQPAA